MSKMTQGMVDSAMVDAIVKIANGHTFHGLGGIIAATSATNPPTSAPQRS